MPLPNSSKKTGKKIDGVDVFTDETIPNCNRCLVFASQHKKTKEKGWFAFCKKTEKMEKIGPCETFHKALKTLTLVKGCDSCEFNKDDSKESLLGFLNERIKEEIEENIGEEHVLSLVNGPLWRFVEYRDYLDINFKALFGVRLFNSLPEDCMAVTRFITPCRCSEDFSIKIQSLAGIIDRMNTNKIRPKIKDKEKQTLNGSVNILEQILKENVPDYPSTAISNLRELMALRSSLHPAHVNSSKIFGILRNLGIDKYPLDDWEKGWRLILTLCSDSLVQIVEAFQSIQ